MTNPTNKQIILASNSPRRRQLLRQIISDFEIAEPRDIEESYPPTLPVEDVAPYLSELKANAFSDLLKTDKLLITADTVVILEDKILGKPHSRDEAVEMLKKMRDKVHNVITGVTLKTKDKTITFCSKTAVHFDNLSDQEIESYVDEFQPYDKAGAYGIQEWIGCRGIKEIEGCFYNVMGLPLNLLYKQLSDF